ncbi:MAG: OmpA family protein [Nitratireductor sp.]|nr:OmpA family protein [Nitratireductor sp.]
MCNWGKWILPGLIAVALLTGLAGMLRSGPVERDLTAKAAEALSASHSWASVELDGRDLKLSGLAPSDEAIAEAKKIADDAYDVRVVDASGVKLLPEAKPFTVSAVKTGDKVELTGYAPSAEMREQIASTLAAALPGASIDNKLELARGMPQGFDTLAGFGMAQLAGLTSGEASLSDTSLSVSGQAASFDAYDAVTGALSGGLPAGGMLASLDIKPPLVETYAFSAEKTEEGIVLDGYVPSMAVHDKLVAAAKASTDNVVDNLRLAAGEPEAFGDIAAFGLSQLNNFSTGSVSLTGLDLSVSGKARDPASYESAKAAFSGALPGGFKLASSDIREALIDPYVWSMSKDEARVSVDGYVPDSETAGLAVDLARAKTANGTAITDNQKIGAGAPGNFSDAMSVAIQSLSRLVSGRADINGTNVSVSGEALTGVAANEIRTRMENSLPSGYSGKADLTVRTVAEFVTPEACQAALTAIMEKDTIQFESGKSAIKSDSFGLLDRLAFEARRCPQQKIEIGGHTDSDGSEEANIKLSQERSNAVRDYLVRSGVLFSRLIAKGYGEADPVADNSTAEGKAKNRRIDFRILN